MRRKWYAAVLAVFLVVTLRASAQEKSPLRLIQTIPLPGFEGGDFDHLNYDLKDNRLYLAAEDHKTVEVFDLRTAKPIHSITGFLAPHAILCPPSSTGIIVTDEDRDKEGWIKLVDKQTYKVTKTITLPVGADVAAFDPVTNYAYIRGRSTKGASSIQVAIVDVKDFKHVGDINFPGDRLEGMAVEQAGKRRLFVGLTGTREVGAADLNTHAVVARWPVPGATPSTIVQAVALDEANHRLFVVCRKPAKVFAFNTETGDVVATLAAPEVMDDLSFDAARKRIYVPGGPSTSVFQEVDPDHYEHIADVPTGTEGQEGKTARFAPELSRYYVALSGGAKPEAKVGIKVFQAEP
jgi:DNA-binding beta-propeller fold protein YncE